MLFTILIGNSCFATDVWIDHWSHEDVDVYIMDDTIKYARSDACKWFYITTKEVKDGQLQRTIVWKFSSWYNEMWRYETSTMDGCHTTVVIPRNNLFEYCMNKIGWSFVIRGQGGISYYY